MLSNFIASRRRRRFDYLDGNFEQSVKDCIGRTLHITFNMNTNFYDQETGIGRLAGPHGGSLETMLRVQLRSTIDKWPNETTRVIDVAILERACGERGVDWFGNSKFEFGVLIPLKSRVLKPGDIPKLLQTHASEILHVTRFRESPTLLKSPFACICPCCG